MFGLDETHDAALRCAVESANAEDTDFPIQNLPFGVFRRRGSEEPFRGGVAIGDQVLDLAVVCARDWLAGDAAAAARMCLAPQLNAFMEAGPAAWSALRLSLSRLLRLDGAPAGLEAALVPQADAEMALPAAIGDYTDFYTSYEHAFNAGSLFRPQSPLFANFKYLPIAYHSRSSSVCVSGTECVRPHGQAIERDGEAPSFGPTRRLDYELELGVFVGPGNARGRPVPLADTWRHVFGLCLLNDWSARDIQRWEVQPLGPFLAKNFLTSISPWIVTQQALAPFMVPWRRRGTADLATLPYLHDEANESHGAADINVAAAIRTARMREAGRAAETVSRSNAAQLYWTIFQMLAHHTSNGCNMRPGDLFGTGTISATEARRSGCLLEVTANGANPITLESGETRGFLEDGDEVIFTARCERPGFRRIGFGACSGQVTAP